MDSFRLPTQTLGWVTRRLNAVEEGFGEKIIDLPEIKGNLLLARQEINELENKIEKLRELDLTEEQSKQLEEWAGTKLLEATDRFLSLENKARCFERQNEQENLEKGSIVSNGSAKSHRSSASSKAESAVRLARLEVEKKFVSSEEVLLEEELKVKERLRQAEEEMKVLSLRRHRMEIEREAAREKATLLTLGQLENSSPLEIPQAETLDFGRIATNSNHLDRLEGSQLKGSACVDANKRLVEVLIEHQNLIRLPQPELAVFDGTDVSLYPSFVSSFEDYVCSRTSSNADKFQLLCSLTKGDAHLIVEACITLPKDDRYQAARKQLEEIYGNPHLIVSAIICRLDGLSQISEGDGQALRRFAIELRRCEISLRGLKASCRVDAPEKIQAIASKLPYDLRKQWRRHATDLALKGEVTFENLVTFTKIEADRMNIPIFGDLMHDKKSNKSLSCATNAKPPSVDESGKKACLFCKRGGHYLEQCFQFQKEAIAAKKGFIRDHGLCFSCLKPGHIIARCPSPQKCDVCGASHASCLHDGFVQGADLPQQPGVSACVVSSGSKVRVAVPIIPVCLSLLRGRKQIRTYAALDNFSSDCFISEELAKLLELQGSHTQLNVSTLEKENSPWETVKYDGLEISDLDGNFPYKLPPLFQRQSLPFTKEHIPQPSDWDAYPHLKNLPFEIIEAPVGLLLGMNASDALRPLEVVKGEDNSPFGIRYQHGWAINGPLGGKGSMFVHYVEVKGEIERMISDLYNQDFQDAESDERGPSVEEREFLKRARSSIQHKDGHFFLDLPLKNNAPPFQCNREQAYRRIQATKNRLIRDPQLHSDYAAFMQVMLDRGFMEPVKESMNPGTDTWYIVHHAVYHKEKGKIRIVFDCSLKYRGVSLNDRLLKGPDLTNNLVGVLLRFRQEPVALQGDIEKMFYMVKIPEGQRDLLRLFWFPDGDLSASPMPFRLTVHVFGAVSSPACANFALKSAADLFCGDLPQVKTAIYRNFYVDDFLKAVPSVSQAVDLLRQVCDALSKAGFCLTDIKSSSLEVLRQISQDKVAEDVSEIDLDCLQKPVEKALGMIWSVEPDLLSPRVKVPDHALSKRGILKVVHSAYDPLGLVGPVMLKGKAFFQIACKLSLDWDQELPKGLCEDWQAWIDDLPLLSSFGVDRNIQPFENASNQVHIFCDGSDQGFAAVAYLRSSSTSGLQSRLIFAKTKLTPMKLQTTPRIELAAAHLGVKLLNILRRELDVDLSHCVLWSDSRSCLCYIANETTCFHKFVANRVQFIREHSIPQQWRYVPSEENPADIASRGSTASALLENRIWLHGPPFLTQPESAWPKTLDNLSVILPDPEVKAVKVADQNTSTLVCGTLACSLQPVDELLSGVHSWEKARRRIAWILLLKRMLLQRARGMPDGRFSVLGPSDMEEADIILFRYAQRHSFKEEVDCLTQNKPIPKSSALVKLCPFLDPSGVMRVGGRLRRSALSFSQSHQVVLSADLPLVESLIQDIHRKAGHMGRERVKAELNQRFWVIGSGNLIKKICRTCLICRRMHEPLSTQLMADLPEERVKGDEPPFSCVGLDCFGPFDVVRGRGKARDKGIGLIFTCLQSRAVHLEVLTSMDASAFINAFRRFIARRGQPRLVRSDRGTNFVGAEKELRSSWMDLCKSGQDFVSRRQPTDWIFHPPQSSHFGGVWEREIRTFRNVFNSVLFEQKLRMTLDNLMTLFCEVEAIMNGRPLTPVSSDPFDLEALTPNHILIPKAAFLPMGLFHEHDCYTRRRWKQVQYLSDLFWVRWKKEYLPLIQLRHKWQRQQINVSVGDLVLLSEPNYPRYQWPLGRVVHSYPDDKGIVRKVKVRTSTGEYERPVTKLAVLHHQKCEDDVSFGQSR